MYMKHEAMFEIPIIPDYHNNNIYYLSILL